MARFHEHITPKRGQQYLVCLTRCWVVYAAAEESHRRFRAELEHLREVTH